MKVFRSVLVVALGILMFTSMASATDVSFAVNMKYATVDTVSGFDPANGDYVVVRGTFNGWAGNDLALTDAGGDSIWVGTYDIAEGSYLPDSDGFKYVITNTSVDSSDQWENVTNRALTVATEAVELDTVWFDNKDPNAIPQDVTFAVNMKFATQTFAFDPGAGDSVVVRGSFFGWGGTDFPLHDEDDDSIWTATYPMDPGDHTYKFVIIYFDGASDGWEADPNRTLTVASEAIELDTVWFNRQEPVEIANVEVLFQVDMSVQALVGNFDPSGNNDIVIIRGDHSAIGNWGGTVQISEDALNPGIYSSWISFDAVTPGDASINYKFLISYAGSADDVAWETDPNRTVAVTGSEEDTDSDGYGEIELDVVYFDRADASGYLTAPKAVTFNVWAPVVQMKIDDPDSVIIDVQTGDPITAIGNIVISGYFNNWPWGDFDPESDDILSDDDNDDVWTTTLTLEEGTAREFIYKYGVNGYDNEAGFAQNHSVTLEDDGAAVTVTDSFGIQGTLYNPYWDMILSVREVGNGALPQQFEMAQNYPNPFNPSTTIAFNLPQAGLTTLRVFNIMGQEVYNHDLGNMNAGTYEITLDASNFSSGVYFYRLESGQFNATKKMMLLK